jgi:Sigma-70 region 2
VLSALVSRFRRTKRGERISRGNPGGDCGAAPSCACADAHDGEAADDLVQDKLVRALRAERLFQGGIRSWLFTIQTNLNRQPPAGAVAPSAARDA